jgi:hypothetical protein
MGCGKHSVSICESETVFYAPGASRVEVAGLRGFVHRDVMSDILPSSASEPCAILTSTGYAVAL